MSELTARKYLLFGLGVCLGLYLWLAFTLALVNDDYMALYTSWLMSVGLVPSGDFHVDSYSLLFELLAPFYYLLGEHFQVLFIFRLLFLALLCLIARQLFRLLRLYVSPVIACVTILFLTTSSAMTMRGLDLRPDLVILTLWLQIIIVLCLQPYRENRKMFVAGFLLVVAMLFKFKAMLIVAVIGVYALGRLCHEKALHATLMRAVAFLFGAAVAIGGFVLVVGEPSLRLFIDTSVDLFFHSTQRSSQTGALKFSVVGRFMQYDAVYWLLALMGFVVAVARFGDFTPSQRHGMISLALLALLSVLANPHYHAYNLVTLYPLMAMFVALALKQITAAFQIRHVVKLGLCLLVLGVLMARAGMYSLLHNNDHQVALNRFIQHYTNETDAVFAFEGIGLLRPSTYHWRTSAIKINNYHGGGYSVGEELRQTRPVLVIESYRVPNWLIEEDRQFLDEHYVLIAPFVRTLGFSTHSNVQGELLRSGWYRVSHSDGETCELDERSIDSGTKKWLEAGAYTLAAERGYCALQWFYPPVALRALRNSNMSQRPYLFSP